MRGNPARPCLQPPLPASWRTPLQPWARHWELKSCWGNRTQCHQKAPVNALEEHKSIDNIELSIMMATRLNQMRSVIYRGTLQLGCHRKHSATRYNSLKSPKLQSKMPAPSFYVNSLHRHFLHRMLRNTLIVIHDKGGAQQMLYAHLCPLRQPQYRLYSRYLCGSLSGLNKP